MTCALDPQMASRPLTSGLSTPLAVEGPARSRAGSSHLGRLVAAHDDDALEESKPPLGQELVESLLALVVTATKPRWPRARLADWRPARR